MKLLLLGLTSTEHTDRGLSTVVGAVLLLGIVVVIATGIGASIGGLGDDLEAETTTSEVSLTTTGPDAVTIEHTGGSSITTENLVVQTLNQTGDNHEFTASDFNITDDVGESFDLGETTTVNLTAASPTIDSESDYDRIAVYYDTGSELVELTRVKN